MIVSSRKLKIVIQKLTKKNYRLSIRKCYKTLKSLTLPAKSNYCLSCHATTNQ